MVAVQKSGFCYISSNSGNAWSKLSGPLSTLNNYTATIMDSAGLNIFIAAQPGYIYRSIDNGYTFDQLSAQRGNWSSLACSSQGKYIVAAQNPGNISLSTNNGNSWILSSSSSNNWFAVSMSTSGQYVTAVVNGGEIYHSSNFGKSNSWYCYYYLNNILILISTSKILGSLLQLLLSTGQVLLTRIPDNL